MIAEPSVVKAGRIASAGDAPAHQVAIAKIFSLASVAEEMGGNSGDANYGLKDPLQTAEEAGALNKRWLPL